MEIEDTRSAEYVEFIDLLSIEKTDIETIFFSIPEGLKSTDWIIQFYAINDLRRFLKYDRKAFSELMVKCFDDVSKLAFSLQSKLAKSTVMLLEDMFQVIDIAELPDDLYKPIIVLLLNRSAFDKVFIKQVSISALENLVKNISFANVFVLQHFIEEISNKNLHISESAYNFSTSLLNQWSQEAIDSIQNWSKIYETLIFLLDINKEPYIKRSSRLTILINKRLGDKFEYTISELNSNLKTKISELIAKGTKKTTERPSIKEFIKNK